MLTQRDFIDLGDLPASVRQASTGSATLPETSFEEMEKVAILRALEEAKTRAMAARMLGVSRATLYRLMEKHGLGAGKEGKEAAG